jgi:glycosyltransferase involved in cell wall biosynthesis
MTDVALYHSNDDLATQLIKGANDRLEGWDVDAITSDIEGYPRLHSLDRARQCMRGYDLIQVDTMVGPGPAAQLAGWLSDTPVVAYLRGWGDYTNYHDQYGWRKRNRIRAKTRLFCRTMDGMAGISEALVAGMSNMYPMGNTRVIERPYDTARFADGDPQGWHAETTVVTVTNLRYAEKRDGVLTMLRAMEPLLGERDGLEYIVAGAGRHLDTVKREAAGMDGVTIAGWVDDIPDLLASADIFAYVSFLDGAPSTVYEAQAAGLPVVGGDAAGVPEAVGEAGMVAPPTPRGMRACIRTLLDDPRRRRELTAASHRKMAQHNERVMYDWQAFWEDAIA